MGVVSGYSVETVFVSQCRKNLWRNPLMFQKISSVGKNLWRRDGGIIFFSSKNFCLTVPKNSVAEPFNVSKKLGFHKNLCIRRANYYFPMNVFGLTVPRKFSLSKNSLIESFHA